MIQDVMVRVPADVFDATVSANRLDVRCPPVFTPVDENVAT